MDGSTHHPSQDESSDGAETRRSTSAYFDTILHPQPVTDGPSTNFSTVPAGGLPLFGDTLTEEPEDVSSFPCPGRGLADCPKAPASASGPSNISTQSPPIAKQRRGEKLNPQDSRIRCLSCFTRGIRCNEAKKSDQRTAIIDGIKQSFCGPCWPLYVASTKGGPPFDLSWCQMQNVKRNRKNSSKYRSAHPEDEFSDEEEDGTPRYRPGSELFPRRKSKPLLQ